MTKLQQAIKLFTAPIDSVACFDITPINNFLIAGAADSHSDAVPSGEGLSHSLAPEGMHCGVVKL